MFYFDLGLKYNGNTLSVYSEIPPTINDALNASIQEKVRRFNNAASILSGAIINIENCKVDGDYLYNKCQDKDTEVDKFFRTLVRNVYMELFIYQEKLLNIVCEIFFTKETKKRETNIKKLRAKAKFFPKLQEFIDKCESLSKENKYKWFLKIRDDEVHNMSQIDTFNFDLKKTADDNVEIIKNGYKIKAKDLREGYIYIVVKLVEIKQIVQDFIPDKKRWEIFNKLNESGEEVWESYYDTLVKISKKE